MSDLPTAQEVTSNWLLSMQRSERVSFESLGDKIREAISQWDNAARVFGIKKIEVGEYAKVEDLRHYARQMIAFEDGEYTTVLPRDKDTTGA